MSRVSTPHPLLQRSCFFQLKKIKKICSPFISTLGKWGLQNKGHATEMPDFSLSMLSSCLCYRKSIIQAVLHYFIFCRLTAGDWWLIQTFSLSFEADDKTIWSVLGVKRSGEAKIIQQSWFMQTEIEWSVSCKQHSYYPFVWRGDGGCW